MLVSQDAQLAQPTLNAHDPVCRTATLRGRPRVLLADQAFGFNGRHHFRVHRCNLAPPRMPVAEPCAQRVRGNRKARLGKNERRGHVHAVVRPMIRAGTDALSHHARGQDLRHLPLVLLTVSRRVMPVFLLPAL